MVINGVKWYFNRDWNRDDMMNLDEIPDEVHTTLKMVYLSLLCTMLSIICGTYLQWISIAGAKFAVLSYVAILILLYFTPSGGLNTRIVISMLAAYSFGSAFGLFASYLFKIEQGYVVRLLAGITIGIGNFLYRAIITTERSEIYNGYLPYCFFLITYGITSILLGGNTDLWTIMVIHTVQILFMGYIVIYSQELLYYANLGDIDFVNCTFTIFFHLPGIVIHAARLILQGAETEQQAQNLELIEQL